MLDIWIQREDGRLTALLSRLSGLVTVCGAIPAVDLGNAVVKSGAGGEVESFAELAAFLAALGCPVQGEAWLLSALGVTPGTDAPIFHSPDTARASFCLPDGMEFAPATSLTQVYQLLCHVDSVFAEEAQYEAWLCEHSHKCRHGLAECLVLTMQGTLAAAACIAFQRGDEALLSFLAVAPAWQGKGCGRLLLLLLAQYAAQDQKTYYLLAAEDSLGLFYEKNGWVHCGRWRQGRLDGPRSNI